MEVSGKKFETDVEINLCEPCKDDHNTTKADGLCQECKEFMCQACFKDHLKARVCRNHILVDHGHFANSNEEVEDNVKCEKHQTESVRFYCRNHNATGCGDCMLLVHKLCAHEYIRDIAKDFPKSGECKAFKEKLENSAFKVNDRLNAMSARKLLVAELERKAVEKIKQFKIDIDSFLNKAEKEILAKLKDCASENNARLSKYEKEMLSLKNETEEVKSQVDVSRGFALFKKTVEHQEIPDKIAEKVTLADANTSLVDFEFVADADLQKLISTPKSLGRILRKTESNVICKKDSSELCRKGSNELCKKESNEEKRSIHDFQIGDRVCRGKDWKWGNQDDNGYGTIVSRSPGWAVVTWNNNNKQYGYRIGAVKCSDLKKI